MLTDKYYDKSADIWSLGVVLSELMRSSNVYRKPVKKERFLFPGKSCYPISPAEGKEDEIQRDDQLFKILKRYPKHDLKADFSFISSDEGMAYV